MSLPENPIAPSPHLTERAERRNRMGYPLRRTGPRMTAWFDFNLQWLWPKLVFADGLGYVHLGWLSIGFGFGYARDAMWDAFDRGLDKGDAGESLGVKK